jgi:hypothetical protein
MWRPAGSLNSSAARACVRNLRVEPKRSCCYVATRYHGKGVCELNFSGRAATCVGPQYYPVAYLRLFCVIAGYLVHDKPR